MHLERDNEGGTGGANDPNLIFIFSTLLPAFISILCFLVKGKCFDVGRELNAVVSGPKPYRNALRFTELQLFYWGLPTTSAGVCPACSFGFNQSDGVSVHSPMLSNKKLSNNEVEK